MIVYMHASSIYRIAGDGLLQLYQSTPVQQFLLSVQQPKENKTIFSPGVLRKVHNYSGTPL